MVDAWWLSPGFDLPAESMGFWSKTAKIADRSNPVEMARSSMRELSERGLDIPAQVATPIFEAERAGSLENASPELKHRFWTAYGTLNSKIKSPEDAKNYYRRFFYGILSALLALQLYYSAFVSAQKGLVETAKEFQAPEIAAVIPADSVKAAARSDELKAKQQSYLDVTNYLMGFPRRLADSLIIIGMETHNGRGAKKPEIVAQVELELATSFVGGFLLPVLYGMLGAIAFVLRRLSDENTAAVTARALKSRYSLRVPIGALSGLAAGWLLQPAGSVTASLSPFALAFVAGYSADLVFTAMDRIVAAFTSPQPAASSPPSPSGTPEQTAQSPSVQSIPTDRPNLTPVTNDGSDSQRLISGHTPLSSGTPQTPAPGEGRTPPSSRAQANLDV
ncbi:hypothetical protein [Bradyrhizobium sp. Ec3.3]|uniref:hypothetical protein n=1 Tax=Bradyrhizobium sp. Ec3.3 TaxID=189753 RepID=UPI000425786E|nr:hypothetical protein [Bradyrhizobium sp. Ec3.3]